MSFILRRTKIVATLGPATDDPTVLTEMVRAGVDVVRLNFSHGNLADHARRLDNVREAAKKAGRYVGVLGDLQGPKIRIERFAAGKVNLADGAEFTLDASLAVDAGTGDTVGIAYKKLPSDVVVGDILSVAE
jgi:pyruvate kinase